MEEFNLGSFRVSDFEIREVTLKDGDVIEAVDLKWSLKTDPSFGAIMKEKGVLPEYKRNKKDEEEEEDEE